MEKLTIIILAAMLGGCASLPPEYSKEPGRCLVKGEAVGNVKALIRSVDDGDVLFVRRYNLGNKVWLNPGPHTLSISCVKTESWGSKISHKNILFSAKENHSYGLQAMFQDETPIVLIYENKPNAEETLLNEVEIKNYVYDETDEYIVAANQFVTGAQNNDLKSMIDVTSPITIQMAGGPSALSEILTQKCTPIFQETTVEWNDSVDIIIDETGNMGAMASCEVNGPTSFSYGVTVMKEGGKFVVISADRKDQTQEN